LSSKKSPKGDTSSRLGLILGLLVTAQFVVVLDFSIVQIALPTIRVDLSMSLADLQWIVSAYGLTFAGFLMFSGRASDLYGRKKLFVIGLMVFSLASLAGGLATSELVLIAARMIQGIGAALASATGLALIIRIFAPLGRLNQALGIFAAVSSAGFSAGIILGGILTEALGWRWIFFVNVPIGILASLLAMRLLPEAGGAQTVRKHLDLPGAASVTGGLMLLVYALTLLGNGDTSYQTYSVIALAGVALAAFLYIEHRSAAPLMPLEFLRRPTVFFSNATALLSSAANVSMIFLLTTYLQGLQSFSALNAALALLPGALIYFLLGGFVAPRLVRQFGAKKVLVAATVILSTGMALFFRISVDSSYWGVILPSLLVVCLGGALSFTASNIAALSGAKQGEEGVASGLVNTSRQVGGPVGLAFAVSVIGLATHGLGIAAPSDEAIVAFRYAFGAAACFSTSAVVTSLLLRGRVALPDAGAPSVTEPAVP
jgi:EmrB/QacA subfamily drug resistance transporter